MVADHDDELARLRAENARLTGLLEAHGIAWRPDAPNRRPPAASSLTTDEKVALFRRLFYGRTDVYPVRWESKAGKSGYAPACANEWKPGICEKPRIKCADCHQRQLIPLTDQTLFDHLAGRHVIGVYPLLADDGCHFLAVDFDEADWRDDARAFVQSCRSSACRSRWRSHAPAAAPTPGSSFPIASRHAMRAGSVPQSSATLATARDN